MREHAGSRFTYDPAAILWSDADAGVTTHRLRIRGLKWKLWQWDPEQFQYLYIYVDPTPVRTFVQTVFGKSTLTDRRLVNCGYSGLFPLERLGMYPWRSMATMNSR